MRDWDGAAVLYRVIREGLPESRTFTFLSRESQKSKEASHSDIEEKMLHTEGLAREGGLGI